MSDAQQERGAATPAAAAFSAKEAQAQIDALREELAQLSEKAQLYAGKAADAVGDAAAQGAVGAKLTIRRYPATAMIVAAGAGAALAMLIAPRPEPRSRYQQVMGYVPDFGGYDLARAINRANPPENLTATGQQIVDSVGSLDVQNNLSAAAERAMAWWDDAKKRVVDRNVGT